MKKTLCRLALAISIAIAPALYLNASYDEADTNASSTNKHPEIQSTIQESTHPVIQTPTDYVPGERKGYRKNIGRKLTEQTRMRARGDSTTKRQQQYGPSTPNVPNR